MSMKKIFSVENVGTNKVFKILGVKLSFRNSDEYLLHEIKNVIAANFVSKDELYQLKKQHLTSVGGEEFSNIETGIIDILPGSFKTYLLENNMPEKIKALKKNLNETSINIIDSSLKKILHLPDYKYVQYYYVKKPEFLPLFEDERSIYNELMTMERYEEFAEKYKLSELSYDLEVLIFHHCLKNSNQKIKDYVKNKDFIDAGAFVGDSALVFFEYEPSQVYSFEISKKNIVKFQKTMELNNIDEKSYTIVKKGLSDKYNCVEISDNATAGVTMFVGEDGGQKTEFITLDSFVKENNLNVGFVKADIEGSMLDAIKGMKETISKCRPVMSLSIYHSPQEFFETKPLLEEFVEDLNYKIEIKNDVSFAENLFGVTIWAYPAELE